MYKSEKKDWLIAEEYAAKYLKEVKKYKIIERNLKTPYGEIDIVAQYKRIYIFVEVKSGSGKRILPSERVDEKKFEKITKSAEYYLKDKKFEKAQIDVIEIIDSKITHYEDIGWDYS